MEEKRLKPIKWPLAGIIIILFITGSAIFLLNNKNAMGNTSLSSMDPETGIQTWITAVNNRDYHRLYTLAPDSIRLQVNESTFMQAQDGNPLLANGNKINSYKVQNETVVGNNAMIISHLVLETPGVSSNTSSKKILLYINFLETFEHGEWKVWTIVPG
jgi:hypothetical protein